MDFDQIIKSPGRIFSKMHTYSHTNSREKTYFLHAKGKLFFFSSKPNGSIDLPPGYTVSESPKTGLPLLKKMEK